MNVYHLNFGRFGKDYFDLNYLIMNTVKNGSETTIRPLKVESRFRSQSTSLVQNKSVNFTKNGHAISQVDLTAEGHNVLVSDNSLEFHLLEHLSCDSSADL